MPKSGTPSTKVMGIPFCMGVAISITSPCAAFAHIVKSRKSGCRAGSAEARHSMTAHTRWMAASMLS